MPLFPLARPRRAWPVLLLALVLALPLPAPAWWPAFTELGVGLQAHTDIDIKGGNLGGLGLSLQTSAPLHATELLRLDLRLAAAAGGFWNYATGAELTLAPGLRLYLPPPGPSRLSPFLEAGLGLAWCDLHIPELGARVNFLSFAGLGLRYGLASHTYLDLGYRVRHVSNAGLDEKNHGITSHQASLEVAWLF